MRKQLAIATVWIMLLVSINSNGAGLAAPLATAKAGASAQPNIAAPSPSWQDQYPDYYKVRMTSATDGWIVGHTGSIRRYTGSDWVPYASPVTATLHSVYPVANTAFAVGDGNTVLQLVGDTWQVTSGTPSCTNFRDVWMTSPSDGWAVGATCALTPTAVLAHYNGSAWLPATVPTATRSLNAIQMLSSSEGWAVGDNGVILHYSGGSWQWVNSGLSYFSFSSIAMLADGSEGWAGFIGSNGSCYTYDNINVLHYANGEWGSTQAGIANQKIRPNPCVVGYNDAYGVAALSADSRWFVGSYNNVGTFGSSYQGAMREGGVAPNAWNGPHGQIADDAFPLNSVYMVAANDVWAVGNSGYIKHFDGDTWHNVDGAPLNAYGLAYNATRGELYQAGTISEGTVNQELTGAILVTQPRTNSPVLNCTIPGLAWKDIASANTPQLDAWAVGLSFAGPFSNNGHVAHVTSAGCEVSTIMTAALNSLVVISPSLAVAVGDSGALAVYNGTWQTATIGVDNLNSIAYKDGRYWAVGDNGVIYTNTDDPSLPHNWQLVNTEANVKLRGVSAVSNNEAWIVGTHVRYHYLSNSLVREDAGSLTSVWMRSASEGWAVGDDGAIQYYNGTQWLTRNYVGYVLNKVIFTPQNEGWTSGPLANLQYYFYSGWYANPYIDGHLLHFAPACYDYYSDVPASHFAHQYILDISCRGIVSGIGNHIYAPAANATRLQFAKIITLARGWPLTTPTVPTFSDVQPSNPLYTFVETAYANGAISGATVAQCQARGLQYPCFFPNDPISRAATAVITVRSYGWPIDTSGGPHFNDVPSTFFAYDAIETAYHRGLVNGVGGGRFAPNDFVTRAQIAKIVDLAVQAP